MHNGMKFSTKDVDNDAYSGSCAQIYHGAWWFEECHYSNLNGEYLGGLHHHGWQALIQVFHDDIFLTSKPPNNATRIKATFGGKDNRLRLKPTSVPLSKKVLAKCVF